MFWETISKIGKAIVDSAAKAVDTAKKVVGAVLEKGKEVARAIVEHPVARTITETVNKVVDSGKKAVAEAIRGVSDAINKVVSANRIEDSRLRNENLKSSAADLSKSARKVADVSTAIAKTSGNVTTAAEVVTATEKKEEPERKIREAELKTEFRKNIEIIIDACKTLPPSAFEIVKSLLLALADAYERDDKEKGWEILRRIFRGEISAASPAPIIAAIIAAVKVAGAWKVLMAVIGAIAGWLGSGLFARFITEEGLQRIEWAEGEALKAGMWDRYKELRKQHDDLLAFGRDVVRSFLLGPVSLLWAYEYYFRASEEQAKTYDEIAKLQKPPEVEPYGGDIATIDRLVCENPFLSKEKIEEMIKPYLPRATVLPKWVDTELRDYRSRKEKLYFAIMDLKKDGNYTIVSERLNEYEKLIDEFENWKESRKPYLEMARVLSSVEAEIRDARRFISDLRAIIKEKTIPVGYIWIVCSLKPDRLWLDETPIEAWTSQRVKVQPGKHLIRAEKDGYHASTVTVEVKADEEKEVRIDFIKKPQEYGYLTVRCVPDCFIYIGTSPTPLKTPLIRYALPPGRYDLTLHLMGYRDEEVSVTIMEGTETVVEKRLTEERPERPEKGRIFVDTEPGGAFVWCDDIVHPYPTDTTLEVDPGLHKIKIEKSGYKTYETEVLVEKGKTAEIRHKLEPLPEKRSWRVVVTSDPPGASVLLDHIPTGKKTPATLSLGVGIWTIGVEMPGYYPMEQTIELR